MLRVFIALTFLSFFYSYLNACEGGYRSCVKKVKDSQSIYKNILQIPITKNKRLVFSPYKKPNGKVLKSDPFLGLYIVNDSKGFKYPFRINMRIPSGIAAVDKHTSIEGKITRRQIGLSQFGKFSYKVKTPALLTNSCCALEGIVTPRGVIEKEYLKRFIEQKDVRYGDIGIRVINTKKGLQVSSYDPFIKNNPFKKGDYILSFDGRKVKDAATLMKKILFSKIGSVHKVEVKRNGKVLSYKVRSQERVSGGYKIETYLEKYGLTFDKDLYITNIDKKKKNYGLKIKDQLFKVNDNRVRNQEDVMNHISDFKLHPRLLFERDSNFQFFVNMD